MFFCFFYGIIILYLFLLVKYLLVFTDRVREHLHILDLWIALDPDIRNELQITLPRKLY